MKGRGGRGYIGLAGGVLGAAAFLGVGLLRGALIGGAAGLWVGGLLPGGYEPVARVLGGVGMAAGALLAGVMFVVTGYAVGRLSGYIVGLAAHAGRAGKAVGAVHTG